MAYMSQDEKNRLAPAIKAVLKKYGMKGTIAVRRYSTLVVNITKGKLDIIGNMVDVRNNNPVAYDRIDERPEYISVNQYYIDRDYTGEVAKFLNELFTAMRGDRWYDNSDIMTDYFDTAYYMDVNVGQWNKPYRYINS